MKKIESQITLTFVIMFIVGFIVNGLLDVIYLGKNFFSFGVMSKAILTALFYLMYVWIYTRRYIKLVFLGILGIYFMLMFAFFSLEGVTFSDWVLKDTVTIIVTAVIYLFASFIAFDQAGKLLEESKK